jgi:enolase
MLKDSETELALVRSALEKARLRQVELEMALDLAHSKAMVNQKALDWDLQ